NIILFLVILIGSCQSIDRMDLKARACVLEKSLLRLNNLSVRFTQKYSFLILFTPSTSVTASEKTKSVSGSVDQYSSAIQQCLDLKALQSLEPIFSLGNLASKALMTPASSGPRNIKNPYPLEALDAETFESVVQQIKGYVVSR